MCGIISVLSLSDNVVDDVIGSLERLEYRGYDSAGIAYINSDAELQRIRSVGKINNLKDLISCNPVKSNLVIGHTRWATHGKVTEANAHPHVSDGVAIVHNGIIENYTTIKNRLLMEGYSFESETDSEIIAVLISSYLKKTGDFISAFKTAIQELVGSFAIVAISDENPNIIVGTKRGSPMAVGMSSNQERFYIASDAVALSSLAEEILYLDEGDVVIANKSDNKIRYELFDDKLQRIERPIVKNEISLNDVKKGGYESFMLKEIFEESLVVQNTYDKFDYDIDITKFDNISIIACGTSYYAGILSKYWIEEVSNIHVDVEIASEFRYRKFPVTKNSLYIFISQSGETIDTLSALRKVKEFGGKTMALVNIDNSSIAREADFVMKTVAGVEVGVASTKAFIAQALSMLLLCLGKSEVNISGIKRSINFVLNCQQKFAEFAKKIKDSRSLFYIGRGTSYPIALEGALKIKELAYISAEGYPAGELKHGPIALIDENIYTIAIAPFDRYFEKTVSNANEIIARNGKILFITTEKARDTMQIANMNVDYIFLPDLDYFSQPFCFATAIHLLAYFASKFSGYDVDKPRNLAKSVTVE